MCNRLTLHTDVSELSDAFGISRVLFYYANQRSLVPNESIAVIRMQGEERTLDAFRWGLMPFWAQGANRADIGTAFERRAFDHLLKRQRCIVPASSFDQVTVLGKKREEVRRFVVPGRPAFGMAAVFDEWNGSFDEELRTCTILTRKVWNESLNAEEHVPVILDAEQMDRWLSPKLFDKALVKELLESASVPPLRELPAALWDRVWDEEELEPVPVRPGMI